MLSPSFFLRSHFFPGKESSAETQNQELKLNNISTYSFIFIRFPEILHFGYCPANLTYNVKLLKSNFPWHFSGAISSWI